MAKLFVDQSFCDFTDGNFIGVHLAILSIGSPIFAAMFNSEMLESETREVYIDDIDMEVRLGYFILFLYKGNVPIIWRRRVLLGCFSKQLINMALLCS